MFRMFFTFCVICVLSFVNAVARADSKQPFSYVQVGHGETYFECAWSETTHLNGTAIAASWQFAPQWFVGALQFESNAIRENCTAQTLSVTVLSITAGYIFHHTDQSDWFIKAGGLHREFPGDEHVIDAPFGFYRDLEDRDDALLSAGARHGLGRFFELTWDAGVISEDGGELYGAANIRWLPAQRFSIGFQYSQYGDFGLAELSARYHF